MSGIIVGIDGSDHSRHALVWAVREAAVRHAPLTVLTVQQPAAIGSSWGASAAVPYAYPYDQDLAKQALKMAQEETDRTLEKASPDSRPPAVTVKDGIVTIEGSPETSVVGNHMIAAIRHMEGVVAVRDRLSYPLLDSPYLPKKVS
jgi:nucleotide-binding universal stress UspA family protein